MSPSRGPALERVLTIGAFGFNQSSFLRALKKARVDLFIDIRARRGVRGAEYAFVNARRLQESLEKAGIEYVHVEDLAPSEATRAVQHKADEESGTPSRQRTKLSEAYIRAYTKERMRGFSAVAFERNVIKAARRPVLFCVETEPGACHRSIVAEMFSKAMKVPVEHLRPS